MNAKVVSASIGLFTCAFGLIALVYPQRVLHLAGFAVAPTASVAQVTGEVRALYGGLFLVMGSWILFAVLREARLLLFATGTMFLGAALARITGAYLEGSPDIWGWIGGVAEVICGFGLTGSAWVMGRAREPWPEIAPPATSSPTISGSPSTSPSSPHNEAPPSSSLP